MKPLQHRTAIHIPHCTLPEITPAMIPLHCSARLLKRMRQPASPQVSPPAENPLGEWCADIDFIDREPYAVLMNAATGMILVLPARAADLRRLHVLAAEQAAALFRIRGLDCALAQAETAALAQPFTILPNRNRSLVSSMNQRKFEIRCHMAEDRKDAFQVAQRMLEILFSRKELAKGLHFPLDLLRARLQPSATILPFAGARERQPTDAP